MNLENLGLQISNSFQMRVDQSESRIVDWRIPKKPLQQKEKKITKILWKMKFYKENLYYRKCWPENEDKFSRSLENTGPV